MPHWGPYGGLGPGGPSLGPFQNKKKVKKFTVNILLNDDLICLLSEARHLKAEEAGKTPLYCLFNRDAAAFAQREYYSPKMKKVILYIIRISFLCFPAGIVTDM